MNPYALEKEILWRHARLRQDMERSHLRADRPTGRLRTWYARWRPSAARAGAAGAAEPRPA